MENNWKTIEIVRELIACVYVYIELRKNITIIYLINNQNIVSIEKCASRIGIYWVDSNKSIIMKHFQTKVGSLI